MTTVTRTRKELAKWPEGLDLLGTIADRLDPPPDPFMEDPVAWVNEKIGEETWSHQDQVLRSIVENRKTAWRSCHGPGKSHIASRAAAWWLDSHPIDQTFVVTTAPSTAQVRGILWRYIKDLNRKLGLGRISEAEVPEWKIDGRLVAWGRKPQQLSNKEAAKTAFQGIHAKYVLVIIDEAGGVPDWMFEAITTLLTSPTNRVLAIGNPDDPQSRFEKINRPGEGWNVIATSAFDTPAYTGEAVSDDLRDLLVSEEWVEEVREEWGEDSPMYISKVLAEFPEVSDDVLITPAMIRKCIEAWEELPGDEAGRYSADIARLGKDKTKVYRNRGGVCVKVDQWAKKDTAETTDRLAAMLEPHQGGVPMVIDIGGLGSGPFDNLRRMGFPVIGFDGATQAVSETAPRPDGLRFLNRRAEQYWGLREEMDHGRFALEPTNLKAQAQLQKIRWDRTATGRIFVEKKESIKKRIGESPDDADSIMMSTVPTDEWELVSQDRAANSGRSREKAKSETGDLLHAPM